jgi:hypothetical protein
MIAHLVLFNPASDLGPEGREQFVSALERAFSNIPEIERAHVGRRRRLGRGYEALVSQHFEFAAVLEFASEEALIRYLDHPAHMELGRLFFASAQATLVYDFEMVRGDEIRRLLEGPLAEP